MKMLRSPWVWIPFVAIVVGYTTAQTSARNAGVESNWGLQLASTVAIAAVLLAIYGGYRLVKWAANSRRHG